MENRNESRQIKWNGTVFDERRKTSRLDLCAPVRYCKATSEGGIFKESVTKDVSAEGCLLLVAEKMRKNTTLKLELYLSDGNRAAMELEGKVVRLNRSEDGLYEYGIEFSSVKREDRKRFAEYCFQKMYEKVGLVDWPTDRNGKKDGTKILS